MLLSVTTAELPGHVKGVLVAMSVLSLIGGAFFLAHLSIWWDKWRADCQDRNNKALAFPKVVKERDQARVDVILWMEKAVLMQSQRDSVQARHDCLTKRLSELLDPVDDEQEENA